MAPASFLMTTPDRFNYGQSEGVASPDAHDLGRKAAAAVAETMRRLLAAQESIRLTVAAGESQTTFLDAVAAEAGIDWSRVACFAIDDLFHPGIPDRFTCGYQVATQLWNKVHPGRTHRVRAMGSRKNKPAWRESGKAPGKTAHIGNSQQWCGLSQGWPPLCAADSYPRDEDHALFRWFAYL